MAKVFSTGIEKMYLWEGQGLKEVTSQMLQELDLRVFEGEFSCCSLEHKNMSKCDKEALRKASLGDLLQQFGEGTCHFGRRVKRRRRTHLGPEHFHGNLGADVPSADYLHQEVSETARRCTRSARLFGPLVEMMAKRVEARDKGTDSVEILQVLHRPKHGG